MHPDKGGSADDFQKLNEAKDVLTNQYKRKMYDKWLMLNQMNISVTEEKKDFVSWFQQEEQRLGSTFHWTDAKDLQIESSIDSQEQNPRYNRNKLRNALQFNDTTSATFYFEILFESFKELCFDKINYNNFLCVQAYHNLKH